LKAKFCYDYQKRIENRFFKMAYMTLDGLNAHIDSLVKDYKGDIVEFSDAIGAARLAYHYGWKVMRIVVTPKTYARHQRILGINFKESFPETTELSHKSVGYNLVLKAGKFWDAVNGLVKIDKELKTQLA
jgi:hypothetical protein